MSLHLQRLLRELLSSVGAYHWVMSDPSSTLMIHYECHTCSMTATMVVTEAAETAWIDHVAIHGPNKGYSAWTWEVLPLPMLTAEERPPSNFRGVI